MDLELIAVAAEGQIAAGRFVLRPARRSDEGLISHYAGDKRVAEATRSIPHPLPPGAAEAFVKRAIAGRAEEDIWIMDGSSTGLPELIGVISLKRMDRAQSEIGLWVGPAFWNTGFASAAVQALLAANPHNDRTIFAEVFQDNPSSAKVLTHAGFQYLGDAETFSVARNARVQTWTYIKKLA